MNKTADIEDAIRFALPDEAITLADLIDALERDYPQLQGQRQWIGVAMVHLKRAGEIRYVGCDHDSHEGSCKVEAVR